jgi:hypothetical protein
MNESEKKLILDKAEEWFTDVIIQNHIRNTEKLKNSNEFDINPFLVTYLSTVISGKIDPISIAKALVYPRALGSSINTSFGQNIQGFITKVLGETFGSAVSGIDIEFIDQIDFRKKYCQVKLGPNTINSGDVDTIRHHFNGVRNLARTNSLNIGLNDLIISVLYGNADRVSANYRSLRDRHHFPLLVGQDFWLHLTGDDKFYADLLKAINRATVKSKGSSIIEETIAKLAKDPEIIKIAEALSA